jgi:AcrR family transcriptional regulator
MPKLWSQTIESHRREVREAILERTAALVAERGMLSVTMSQIAEEAGIGRATLYKYFPDVEAILHAWHAEQIKGHLAHLVEVRDRADRAGDRLGLVLEAYGEILRGVHAHAAELAGFLHRDHQVVQARVRLHTLIRALIADAAATGDVRNDVGPGELATYCLHAMGAASTMRSKAGVQRLVDVTIGGLRPS